jgi:hypothetical protein
MGDADAFAAFAAMVLVAEGDESVSVLKSDSARGLEARRGEAQKFVEENATVRVASAFRHEFELRLVCATTCAVLSYHRNRGDHLRSQRRSAECWMIVRDSKLNSSARAEGGNLLPASLARDCRFMQKRKIALCAFSFFARQSLTNAHFLVRHAFP